MILLWLHVKFVAMKLPMVLTPIRMWMTVHSIPLLLAAHSTKRLYSAPGVLLLIGFMAFKMAAAKKKTKVKGLLWTPRLANPPWTAASSMEGRLALKCKACFEMHGIVCKVCPVLQGLPWTARLALKCMALCHRKCNGQFCSINTSSTRFSKKRQQKVQGCGVWYAGIVGVSHKRSVDMLYVTGRNSSELYDTTSMMKFFEIVGTFAITSYLKRRHCCEWRQEAGF
jgi:hypothetical protein